MERGRKRKCKKLYRRVIGTQAIGSHAKCSGVFSDGYGSKDGNNQKMGDEEASIKNESMKTDGEGASPGRSSPLASDVFNLCDFETPSLSAQKLGFAFCHR